MLYCCGRTFPTSSQAKALLSFSVNSVTAQVCKMFRLTHKNAIVYTPNTNNSDGIGTGLERRASRVACGAQKRLIGTIKLMHALFFPLAYHAEGLRRAECDACVYVCINCECFVNLSSERLRT